jgi:hypothetical protein
MDQDFAAASRASRRKPLALCVSAFFAFALPGLGAAATWTVNDCSEGSSGDVGAKTGTLRFAAEHAASGDLITLHTLSCPDSKISLATGSITFMQQSLTIVGPGSSALQIDGSADHAGATGDYRIFTHGGDGKLTVQDIGLTGGHAYQVDAAVPAKGGCLYSKGSVDFIGVAVASCHAHSGSDLARGGGVYALGDVELQDSVVSGSDAAGSTGAFGGGVYTKGQLTLRYSILDGNTADSGTSARGGGAFVGGYLSTLYATVSGNHANGTTASARGGGLVVRGTVSIEKSTISGNVSQGDAGGVLATNETTYASNTVGITASTISGNSAAGIVGGLYTDAGKSFISGSTIVFNTATIGETTDHFAPGVAVAARSSGTTVELQSTILSNNTYAATENDLSVAFNTISVAGQENLVRSALGVSFFNQNITACPRLGPLRDNGGPTLTHALLSGSPAIDAGNLVDQDVYDQRGGASSNGTFDYFRVSGAIGDLNPQPDIGAYEMQQDDIVFDTGFDGCP